MQEIRNHCFSSKKCNTIPHQTKIVCWCHFAFFVFIYFPLTKGRIRFFRPETMIESFLHLMMLLCKVFTSHVMQSHPTWYTHTDNQYVSKNKINSIFSALNPNAWMERLVLQEETNTWFQLCLIKGLHTPFSLFFNVHSQKDLLDFYIKEYIRMQIYSNWLLSS